MKAHSPNHCEIKLAIIGLGYVGLPLVVESSMRLTLAVGGLGASPGWAIRARPQVYVRHDHRKGASLLVLRPIAFAELASEFTHFQHKQFCFSRISRTAAGWDSSACGLGMTVSEGLATRLLTYNGVSLWWATGCPPNNLAEPT
jgi:hypothetical protein